MKNKDIVQQVADKVESEITIADNIVDRLKLDKFSFTNTTIREFFPRHERLWGSNRTNLISDVSIASQLIYSSPVTIDLYPETIAQFEKRYKIDYKAALLLAEEGWIFPNLYFQNPKDWYGYPELQDLIEFSTGNGIRANKYLANRFPSFEQSKKSRIEESRTYLEQLKSHKTSDLKKICLLLSASEDSAARVLGNRWAYIDCFSPDSSEVFRELLYARDYANAFDYLEVVQNLTVSPISGSLGGHLTWSSSAISKLRRILNSNMKYRSKITLGIAEWQIMEKDKSAEEDKRINEFLLQQITGASPYENLELSGASKLSTITKNKDFKEIKLELNRVMSRIAEKSHQGINDIELKEWISLTKEVDKQVTLFKNIGAISTTGLSLALGLLTSSWQVAIGVSAVSLFDFKTNLFANGLHNLFNSNQHRFGVTVSKLNELVSEI